MNSTFCKIFVASARAGVFLLAAVALAGCSFPTPQEYKAEADRQVYEIIDDKWDEQFSSKANYRVNDVPAGPNDLQIARPVPPSGVLTLPRAVAVATAQNREYQLQKDLLYTAALNLTLARHDFDRIFFGIGSGGYNKDADAETAGADGSFGFNQLLPAGALINTQVTVSWADVLSGDLEGGLTSVLSANLIQPLLRGSGRQVVQENLTQAERDALYQIRAFNRFRKAFVVSIITQYYFVLERMGEVEYARQNLQTLSRVVQLAEKLARAGRLPLYELEEARQDKIIARDTLIQAEKLYKQTLDEFKLQLAMPPSTDFKLDASELEVLRHAPMPEPAFTETEAIETAFLQRLDLANAADAVTDAERKIVVAADSLRGDLNVVAGGSVPLKDLTPDSAALDETATLALQFGLPLDRVLERNLFRQAFLTLLQSRRQYEQLTDTVELEIRTAYRNLREAAERYKTQQESLELAQKRFRDTRLMLQYARANTRDVLDAQQDLFRAQDDALDAMFDYMIATLDFYRDTGVMRVRPDGMWERTLTASEIASDSSTSR